MRNIYTSINMTAVAPYDGYPAIHQQPAQGASINAGNKNYIFRKVIA